MSQASNVLDATVSINADAPVIRATLFRNNRPIAMMTPEKPAIPQLNLITKIRKGGGELKIANGSFISAGRQLTEPGSDEFVWDKTMLKALNCYPWFGISARIAAQPDLQFDCKLSAAASVEFDLNTLITEQTIQMDDGRVSVSLSPIDVNVNSFSPSKAARLFHASIYCRSKYDNDILYVLLETADGQLFCSDIVAPFLSLPEVNMTILQTSVNMETSSGATGMPGRSGYLSANPPFSTPESLTTAVNPLAIQHSYWPLDYNKRNLTGERPIRINPEDFDADKAALRLDGKKVFKLPARLWPMSACTIAFKFNPDKAVESRQALLLRNGWSSAFDFHMLPDNTLEVTRGEHKLTGKIELNRWNQVRLSYDGITARLFIDEKEVSRQKIPISITFGNCTAHIGGGKEGEGVSGLFKELAIQSAPTETLSDLHLPQVKPQAKVKSIK
jgi:hypothetical protein